MPLVKDKIMYFDSYVHFFLSVAKISCTDSMFFKHPLGEYPQVDDLGFWPKLIY